jgi:RNA polymerase sigma-70 factor (ECF subfamily)
MPRVPSDPPAEVPELAAQVEARWLRAAQAGDRSAFAQIVEAYWDRLYRWLFQLTRDRHRAEDLTQETFLKALAALKSFKAGTNFRAWLFRIGHNNFVNLKRADRRATVQIPEETSETGIAGAGTIAADREALTAVQKAIADLPVDFRVALLLRAEEGLSFKDMAAILQTTEETARWRVFKARQKLLASVPPDFLPPPKAEAE